MLDYIIIGGGSAGCVLAARLSEDPAIEVALLEAGPPDNSLLTRVPAGLAVLARTGRLNWNFSTVPQAGLNGRTGYQPRGRVLGGSSAINAMIYVRGQPQDYDLWAAEGNPGWAFEEVLPYFKKAEHNERGADAFHATGGPLNVTDAIAPNRFSGAFVRAAVQAGCAENPDFNGTAQDGVGLYQLNQIGGERCSAARAYLSPHLGRANLHVITQAHATRILLERKRAVGVQYHQGGEVKQLKCSREVIVCAGALQSPQLLMLSGIGEHHHLLENGIATRHELPGVGENLHDHPDVTLVVNLPTRAPHATESFGLSAPGLVRAAQGALEWQRQRSGPLTSNFGEAGGFIKSRPEVGSPDLQLHFVPAKLVNHGRSTVLGHGYSCHVCLLRPKSRGSVKLASKDPHDAPLIDPNFLAVRDDMERLLRGFKRMRHILSQQALADYGGQESAASRAAVSDLQLEHYIRNHADSLYHPVGSCRMGSGPLDVVDAQLRVHGLAGLRVVDASVMPHIVSGNTNAPVIMLAEKAADMIKAVQQAA
jgi:choline dehydrogenase-like flavoprotein